MRGRTILVAGDAKFHKAIDEALTEEHARCGGRQTLTAVKDLVGDRPAGSTSPTSPVVLTVQAVARALGLDAP